MRTGRWGSNLREDLGEERNRTRDEPERALRMQRQLAAWRQAVGAQRPEPMSVPR